MASDTSAVTGGDSDRQDLFALRNGMDWLGLVSNALYVGNHAP